MLTFVRHPNANRNGTVLIVAMWIVIVLAGLVLVFGRSMRVEVVASANHVAALQADAIAQGALQFVLSEVDGSDGTYTADPAVCEAVEVGDGFFWILNPSFDDDRAWYFGIRDESSRINVNTATEDMLLKLPGMTAELAASIVDWRDADNDISPGGAENEYYLLLADPYYCKNAAFEAVEELVLVRGTSAELLYGEDANRNGVLDSNENDGIRAAGTAAADPGDNRDGHLDRGLFDYVTVCSREPNLSSTGEQRVDVNESNMRALSDILRSAISDDRYFQVMDRVRGGRPFSSIFDFYFKTGLTSDEFTQIADRLTTSRDRVLSGRVNVNTAPRQVLLCLPGLEESDVDALIAHREASDSDVTGIAWAVDVLSREKAVGLGDTVTSRSYQFSADIVAVSGNGRAFRRYRAVIDAIESPPRVRCWKDLTHLGWPLDPEILTSLRSGEGLSSFIVSTMAGGR